MNGIKYIREKSNFTKNALAERMGVTRQTVTLWENGARKPDRKHLQWLCEFYGIDGKWFGDLSDDEMETLNDMNMYRHYDGDKEYFNFIPEIDGWAEPCFTVRYVDTMIDDRYAETMKRKKAFMQDVERFLRYECRNGKPYTCDKIVTAERGMADIECFIELMNTVHGVGTEGLYLKVPFRFEIKTAIFALMIVSGQYSKEEIMSKYSIFFEEDGLSVDREFFDELIEMMGRHWNDNKTRLIEQMGAHKVRMRKK